MHSDRGSGVSAQRRLGPLLPALRLNRTCGVWHKKLKELAEVWGKLPEKDRAKAMAELTRDMPPRYREVIEKYFKKLAESGNP